jgi:hypothetical protein
LIATWPPCSCGGLRNPSFLSFRRSYRAHSYPFLAATRPSSASVKRPRPSSIKIKKNLSQPSSIKGLLKPRPSTTKTAPALASQGSVAPPRQWTPQGSGGAGSPKASMTRAPPNHYRSYPLSHSSVSRILQSLVLLSLNLSFLIFLQASSEECVDLKLELGEHTGARGSEASTARELKDSSSTIPVPPPTAPWRRLPRCDNGFHDAATARCWPPTRLIPQR